MQNQRIDAACMLLDALSSTLSTGCQGAQCVPLVYSIHGVMALSSVSLQAGEPQQGGWSALLNGRYRRIMILASALPILQQLSGINTVVFYSSDVSLKSGIRAAAGFAIVHITFGRPYPIADLTEVLWQAMSCLLRISLCLLHAKRVLQARWHALRVCHDLQVFAKAGLESPVLGSIIVGAVNVMGTLVAAFLMDHAGRRQLLLVSHVIMAACLSGLAISTWLPCEHPSFWPNTACKLHLNYPLSFWYIC